MAKRNRGNNSKKRRKVLQPLEKRLPVLTAGRVTEVDDSSFDRLVKSSPVPVLVDFWAPWCGPCKAVAPILEAIASDRSDLRVVKYNTEANSRVAQELAVRSIPTLALFRDGETAAVKVGAANKSALNKWIDSTLNPRPGLLSAVFG